MYDNASAKLGKIIYVQFSSQFALNKQVTIAQELHRSYINNERHLETS